MVDIGMRGNRGPIKVRIGHIPQEKDGAGDFELWTLKFTQGESFIKITTRDRTEFALLIRRIREEAKEWGVLRDV